MRDLVRRCLAELVGTFFLVLVGVGAIAVDAVSGSIGHVGISLAFGLVVAAMVYATGHVSGAHLNPAVTVALAGRGRFPASEVPAYALAQLTGAGGASLVLRGAMGLHVATGVTAPSIPMAGALATETLITFALVFVIASVATDDRAVGGLAGVAIGMAVAMGALMAGPLTGASMNPARSFGPALVAGQWAGHWLYWIGPMVGGALGAAAYDLVRAPTAEATGEAPLAARPLGEIT